MEFEALKKVKQTNELCNIHRIPLIQYESKEPFCIECRKEYLRNLEQKVVDESFNEHEKRRTIEVLSKDSIVGDSKLWHATFKNYISDNDETKKALTSARKIANEYMEIIQTEKKLKKIIKTTDEAAKRESAEVELLNLPKFNTIFTGVPGVGKSHLSMSMLKAINENATPRISCLFVSTNDLFRMIKSSFGKPDSKYTEINMTNLLVNVDLLVLDDLGSEASFQRQDKEASNYTQSVLFGILNARQRTIITTNLTSNNLEEIYNAKIISRLYKGVEGHLIKFTKATSDKRSKIQF